LIQTTFKLHLKLKTLYPKKEIDPTPFTNHIAENTQRKQTVKIDHDMNSIHPHNEILHKHKAKYQRAHTFPTNTRQRFTSRQRGNASANAPTAENSNPQQSNIPTQTTQKTTAKLNRNTLKPHKTNYTQYPS